MPTMTATEPIAPPPSSVLTTTPAQPDDIPDPAVPEAVLDAPEPTGPVSPQWREHEALLHGFCQHVQTWMLDYHKSMMRCMEATLGPVQQCLTQAAAGNEHAQYQISDVLLKMQEHGIRVQTTPYMATVHAISSHGYGLDLQIQKTAAPELVDALQSLMAWLEQAGFSGVQVQASA